MTDPLEWHRTQAARLRRNKRDHAVLIWEIGRAVNRMWPDGQVLPVSNLYELCDVYERDANWIASARRFAARTGTEKQRDAIIEEYGHWSNIRNYFLGPGPGPRKEPGAAGTQRFVQHIANCPDSLRDEIMAQGYSRIVTQRIIRHYIEHANAKDIVRIWQMAHGEDE